MAISQELSRFLREYPHMAVTKCIICGEETLFAKRQGPAPKTCGRYRCMRETGETGPLEAA